MKKIFILLLAVAAAWMLYRYLPLLKKEETTARKPAAKSKDLLAYDFENLRKTPMPESNITAGKDTGETETTRAQVFYYETPARPGSTKMLKVSGLMNLPKKPGTYPVIVMYRGFVPDDIYAPGVGTQHVAEQLAAHGYITLAPDFLGFAGSDKPSADSFESRFQTYTTAISLLASLPTLNRGLEASYSGSIQADITHVGIWGHSNGGHIALSVLAITGIAYPTVLWAPVSKPFPYSILYYSDEAEDQGKAMRKVLASFEQDYDADLFSPVKYYGWIKAPLTIEQGSKDEAVPERWSSDLAHTLEGSGLDVAYHVHPGADHNMVPDWNSAVSNSIAFFDKEVGKTP